MSNVLDLNYDNFAASVSASGHTPKKQNDNLFVTKTDNSVKVEITKLSNAYVVGFGLPVESREIVDAALEQYGFKQMKKLKTHTMYTYESLPRFIELIGRIEDVDGLGGKVKAKETTAKKIKTDVPVVKVKIEKTKIEPAQKTDDEIARIKDANLKRMKEYHAKMKAKGYMPGQYANPETLGVPDGWTAEAARTEVDQMYKELESFQAPSFLTKRDLKTLV
jgi:hypothetical protein